MRAGAVAASTKPRGHFAKGDAKQPGKHARGHLKGTRHKKRKREGGISGTVNSPHEMRIPDGYHPRIAYIVRERSGGRGEQYSSNANVILASETVSDTPELSTCLHKDSHFKIRVFASQQKALQCLRSHTVLGFLGFALGKLGKLVVLTRRLDRGSHRIKPADGSPVKHGPETEPRTSTSLRSFVVKPPASSF